MAALEAASIGVDVGAPGGGLRDGSNGASVVEPIGSQANPLGSAAMSAQPATASGATTDAQPSIEPGRAWPLGAHVVGPDAGGGVNFAVHAGAAAYSVELCLYDDAEGEMQGACREIARFALPGRSGYVWHGRVPQARAGTVYGYRVHGPWQPSRGLRFNRHKLLLDPYAREIVGRFDWAAPHFGADALHPQHMDMQDNGDAALKARVVDDRIGDRRQPNASPRPPKPFTPAAETVIYEMHVKGFTRRHPEVPEALRGTYAGLATAPVIGHLQRLGITAVSLLPVQQHLDEERLVGMGLSNYWGYNTIGFFCPEPTYAMRPESVAQPSERIQGDACRTNGAAVRTEFRAMVDALHAAGIEVLLDVVYNHTAESDERGPTIAWRGFDNAGSYRLDPADRARYLNWTGCGNTLDLGQPRMLQLVADSLRYWVETMGVDGFRFDLGPILGRVGEQRGGEFDARAAFFQALAQDPVLAGAKLIAEPWDLGPHGYRLGGFPRGWLEWNDRFRDAMRAFWLGGACTRGEFAQRLCASSDLFQPANRPPSESINYVVSHDGFTLRDLVSYDRRRNEQNGESGRDGHANNLSWNAGHEGETGDPQVLARRGRLMRALLACNLLAQGTPMLSQGSEIGHTQHGNNNPYCQDNEIGWLDWSEADADLLAFTRRLLELRRAFRPLADRWYTGIADAHGLADLAWVQANGEALQAAQWNDPGRRVLGALIGAPGAAGIPLLLLFDGEDADVDFALPNGEWTALLDSAEPTGELGWTGGGIYPLRGRSVAVLVANDAAGAVEVSAKAAIPTSSGGS